MLGIELISDTIGKLNTMYVVTTDDTLIPLYLLTHAYWTIVLDLGTVGGSLWLCCHPRASGLFSCFVVHVSSCQPVGVQGVSASYDEPTALVKCGKFKVTRENTGALAYCWCSCEDRCRKECQVNSFQTKLSDLLEKFERFRHAVVEPFCRGILRSIAHVDAGFFLFFSCE